MNPRSIGLAAIGWVAAAAAATQPARAQLPDVLIVKEQGVGISTDSPQTTLEIVESDDTKADRVMVRLTGTDFWPQFEYHNQAVAQTWRVGINNVGDFVMNQTDDLGLAELRVKADGSVFVNGTQIQVPDYVFEEGYELMPLTDLEAFVRRERHLPDVAAAQDVEQQGGLNLTTLPLQLLQKIEELTLYTIEQDRQIRALTERLERLEPTPAGGPGRRAASSSRRDSASLRRRSR